MEVSATADPDRAEIEVVQRIEIDPQGDNWDIIGSEYLVRSMDDLGTPQPALILTGPKRAIIRIPGEFVAGEFDTLVLTMRSTIRPTVSARIYYRGNTLAQSDEFNFARKKIEILRLPLEMTAGSSGKNLEITIKPVRETITIYDIALTKIGHEAHLPTPENGSQLFEHGGDARRALGVSRTAPLNRTLEIAKGARMAFDYAWPKIVQDPETRGQIVVRLVGEDRQVLNQKYPLKEDEVWTHVELELDEFAGQTTELQIGIRGGKQDRETTALITEPVLYVPAEKPSTVLLVTSDTHRFDYVGRSNSDTGIQTPYLDALAARGVFFENCLTSTNVTLPSHVALLTGHSPRDTGVLLNNVPLADQAPTLAEHFAAQGYQTLAVVAVEHLGNPESNLGQGFDRMAWPSGHFDAADVVDRILDWEQEFEGRSLFVWAHVFDAHAPYTPPEESFIKQYYPGDPYNPELPDSDFQRPRGWEELRDINYVLAQYSGEVTYLDRELGRLFQAPRFAEGIIAFTADHGESLGAHDLWWTHGGLYPDTIHVPLILTWPGAPVQRDTREVRQIEVGRTLLDLAELDPGDFPGRSLIEHDEPDTPRFAIASGALDGSVTMGKWHLTLNLQAHPGRKTELHKVELYDLVSDPKTQNELSSTEPQRTAAMRRLLVEWLLDVPETRWAGEANNSEENLQALAELGYVISAEGANAGTALFDNECSCPRCSVFREAQ